MAGGLFKVPERTGRAGDSAIAKKANAKSKKSSATVKGGGDLFSRISSIRALVEKHLGYLKDEYIVIRDETTLHDYITKAIENSVISIDTETTGLDPLQDEIVGICIYTPGMKSAYIPVHHVSYVTGEEVDNQLSVEVIRREFERINEHSMEIVMFNSAFDMRFMKNRIGVSLVCTWDCYLAARLLNENEGPGNNRLKPLHKKYCTDGEQDAFVFDDLFSGITFNYIPINTAYLYAAHDPIITYELYDFQRPFLTPDDQECVDHNLQDVAWVFHNIEMPCVPVVAEMEDTGVAFDMEYDAVLHDKYHAELQEKTKRVYEIIHMYDDEIAAYKKKNPNAKLSDPINIDSPVQIAILMYDIMKLPVVDDKSPRGTGEEIMLKHDNPLCKAILDYRGVGKLISTYIDKLPSCVNPNDGRIHCKFNQYGADTGRFSSQDPNLQNIPSHNKDIRKMFKATDGYILMSSDFSQQEPKCLAALCRKQGDSQMYDTFMQGKDLYSEIASKAFNVPYEDCREFRPDGTTNAEGKNRRSQAKSILLGVLYGRGVPSIAEQLGCSTKKAQSIKDSVFEGFPAIKEFEEDSLYDAKNLGYVTTVCGRKRRLPVLRKPDYEFRWKDGVAPDDNPLDFDDVDMSTEVPMELQRRYLRKLNQAYFGQKRKIFEQANEEGVWIDDNTKLKQDAIRQVVNSRIQGSAADLSKLAMIKVGSDERMKELGFRLLIPVHDELIGECPESNVKECSERLAKLMSDAAEEVIDMPIKCDVECTYQWYGQPIVF